MNNLFTLGLYLFILLTICSAGGKKSGVIATLDPDLMTTPPDDKIICWAGDEQDKEGYIDINYKNEEGDIGVDGDVCDHEDSTVGEFRDTCYFYVKTDRSQWKRSCLHHSFCPLGDNIMGCGEEDGAITCCCKGNYCNAYETYAELGDPNSYESPDLDECDLSELIRPCPCFATDDLCEDAQVRAGRTECCWTDEGCVDNGDAAYECVAIESSEESEGYEESEPEPYEPEPEPYEPEPEPYEPEPEPYEPEPEPYEPEPEPYESEPEPYEPESSESSEEPYEPEPYEPEPEPYESEPEPYVPESESSEPIYARDSVESPESSDITVPLLPCGGHIVIDCPPGYECTEPKWEMGSNAVPTIGFCEPAR